MVAAGPPALLMVYAVSSLASIDYRHDEWRVDVAIGGSQKGMMLPPGLAFNALSDKDTVAVLTTTVAGIDGGPRVFSAGLDPAMLEEVQRLLGVAEAGRQEEVPCVGFHCFVRPREEAE